MVEPEIDPYPVSELTTRFGIGRTALYARLNALTIVPTKQGGKAFVSSWQLQRLDALHEHLKKGGALADFERVHRPDVNPAQDQKLTPGEIEKLKRGGVNPETDLKGGIKTGQWDLYKDKKGNIYVGVRSANLSFAAT